MPITDPAAIKFSNEQLRVAADKLARCFYRSHELFDAWDALVGTNDAKMALLLPQIRNVANLIGNTYRFVWWADRLWQSGSLVSLFPNDTSEVWDNVDNTDQDPGRPPINGQDCRRLKNHMEEFANWLGRDEFLNDNLAFATEDYSNFDDVAVMTGDGAKTPIGNWAKLLADDRCGELVTEWETTNPSYLTHILKVSVNPQEEAPQ